MPVAALHLRLTRRSHTHLREVPQPVAVVEDDLPVAQSRGAEASTRAEGDGGDHGGRLCPLEHAALRDGPHAQLAVHAARDEVGLLLGVEIDGCHHVPRCEAQLARTLVLEDAQTVVVVRVPQAHGAVERGGEEESVLGPREIHNVRLHNDVVKEQKQCGPCRSERAGLQRCGRPCSPSTPPW